MIFPIGDDNIEGAKPLFSYIFIAMNVGIFLWMFSMSNQEIMSIYHQYATIPSLIVQGEGYSTLLTNTFLHGGLLHLLGNMLFMWIFADNIEAVMGSVGFVLFYVAGGIFASLAHVMFNMQSSIPSLGASGALAAVMGAYLVFFPKSRIKILVIYLFRNFHISALYFLGLWIVFQFISSFMEIGKNPDASGTAWWAHIGGFIFGVVVALVLKQFGIIRPSQYQIKA